MLDNPLECIGWIATALFTTSFFFKSEVALLRSQLVAASLWIVYGVINGLMPVIVANVLVAAASCFKQVRLHLAGKKSLAV